MSGKQPPPNTSAFIIECKLPPGVNQGDFIWYLSWWIDRALATMEAERPEHPLSKMHPDDFYINVDTKQRREARLG